jgi:hypothetical protein
VVAVLAVGVGLVFGFTFDTSGPRRPGEPVWEASAPDEPATVAETPEPTVVHDGRTDDRAPERVA